MEKKQYKILVVDDDCLSQRMMGLVLSDGGYSYDTAFNGADAVEAVQTQHFDLVLMDLQMPILDGYEATRKIREWEAGKSHVPIVALTAMMFDEDVQLCYDAGMDDCIIKPFDTVQLYQMIDAHIEKSFVVGDMSTLKVDPENPLLDIQAALPRFGKDIQIYQEFLSEFLAMLPERLEQFQTAFESGDFQALSKNAHNLKGVAASMGAIQLSSLASRLDLLCRDGVSKQIEKILLECHKHVSTLQDDAMIVTLKYIQNQDTIK